MAIWFKIAIPLNILYWAVFFSLLSRRRWSWSALAVGIFHMLFAGVCSVAPIRSLIDPDYIGFGVGVMQFAGSSAALPAALILSWALFAAWIAVGKGSGRLMTLIAVGDILLALSLGASILQDSAGWKLQFGEHLTIDGYAGATVLLLMFTLPLVLSALWAVRRARFRGTPPPLSVIEKNHKDPGRIDGGDHNLRFQQSPA
jgi:hypothetical protein